MIDEAKLQAFLGKAVGEMGAAVSAALVLIGDKLGLYRAMAAAGGPISPGELAMRTGTAERYVREWLAAQAAGGYVTYDPATRGGVAARRRGAGAGASPRKRSSSSAAHARASFDPFTCSAIAARFGRISNWR